MDFGILPAVALLMVVLLSIPQNADKKRDSGRNIANYSVTKSTIAELDVAYPRRNAFRRRYDDEKSPKNVAKPVTKIARSSDRSKASDPPRQTTRLTATAGTKVGVSDPEYRPKNKATKASGRMTQDLDAIEDQQNYESIKRFIQKTYRRVPTEEAELIAKSLVEYGRKHNLDPKFAAAVMARESAFNRHAVSSSGAKGLGQIKDMNYKSLKITDPHDIQQNTQGTVKYLRRMLGIWQDKSEKVSLALASYYKGHGAVKRDNEQLDTRTQGYVNDILKTYEKLKDMKEKQ